MLNRIKTLAVRYRELIVYVIVGGCTTLVSYGLLLLLHYLLGLEENLSNIISIIAAILFAYVANKRFVFRSHCESRQALLREMLGFFASRAFAMGVEVLGFYLLNTLLELEVYLSKLLINVLIIILNYVLSKWLVFRKKSK